MADSNAEPTQAQIDAAQDVLRRAQEAAAQQQATKMKPLTDITASPEYAALQKMVNDIPPEFMADMNVAPHIMALRSGFNGLNIVAPAPVAAPQPAPVG